MRTVRRFTRGQQLSGLRPHLNELVSAVNGTPDPAGSAGALSGFLANRILVLVVRGFVPDLVDPTLSRLTCSLPGQELNPSAQVWSVSLPWRFTDLTRDGVTYVYTDINNRTADGTEVQELTQPYIANDEIMVGEFEQGTAWRDLNIDGRMWAKVP